MRKKVEFKDKKERIRALLDGRVFYKKNEDYKIHYDEALPNPLRIGVSLIQASFNNDWYEEIKLVWPKDFKPCWCWVSDFDEEEKDRYRFIDDYDPEGEYPFRQHMRCNDNYWKLAKPMTKEEVLKFCWEEITK